MFLLDTNAVSELRNGKPKQSQAVRAWAAAQSVNTLYLSAVTVLELETGVQLMARKDDVQGSVLRDWLDQTRAQFNGRILALDEAAVDRCAPLYVTAVSSTFLCLRETWKLLDIRHLVH